MKSLLAFSIMAAITVWIALLVGTKVAHTDSALFATVNRATAPAWRAGQ